MEALDQVLKAEAQAREIRQTALERARAKIEEAREAGERILSDAAREAAERVSAQNEESQKEIAHLETSAVGDAEVHAFALRKRAGTKKAAAVEAMLSIFENSEKL